jgi:AcrR family transcriptional regulator
LSKAAPSKTAKPAGQRRPRRSTEQVIGLIIDAACAEFELNGYEKTKTATIARKAGVAEALIFSNFGSKARLFQDSIFKPLEQHLQQFQATHTVDSHDSEAIRAATGQYIAELQQFIGRHSRMLKSVIAAQMYGSEGLEDLKQVEGLHDFFNRASTKGINPLSDHLKISPKLLTRVSFATILACTLFKDLLFPKGMASPDRISQAISDFVMDGLNANADPQPEVQAAARSRRSPTSKKTVRR